MAKADRETIRALLTDTVTLLCRNSLPFSKQLKVQGLLGITVDEADFYIIQIDEEYGDGGPPGIMERAMPPVARAPMCSIPAKRPKTTIAGRTPVCRVAQTVPRRMRGGMIATSPGSAMARQKVRQQLNFPSPQRGMHNPAAATAATPANAKQMFAMRSPQSSSRLSAPVTPIRTPPVGFAQSSRTPLSQQKPRKMMLMLEDGKKPSMEQPPPPLQRQMPTKPMPKVEKMELFSGGFGKMPPVKMERSHGDVICVESDEENSEAKRMPDLVPYSGGAQSAMQDTGEDDKTKALHAIMNQALNEARGVSSSLADSYQGDSYQGEGNYISSFQTASGMYNESVVKKMEPVSSSQLTESDMAYDTSELGSTQFVDDFNSGLDMKPFFDQNPLQMSWDASAPPQSMSSPSWHLPPSQSQTPTRSSSQSVGSPSWIKTENTQVPQKMLTNVMRNKVKPLRSPKPSAPGSAYSSPQHHLSPPVPSCATSTVSVQQQQDASGIWTSVTTTKFICNINNCEKEFTTKRAMRHHQKTIHGAIMGGHSSSDSPGAASNYQYDTSDS